jgi:GTPase SAR1 family protein
LRRIEAHTGTVNVIALLPGGKRFIAGDYDGYIRNWPIDDVAPDSHLYTTARIALLGDSGVGKTGLGWCIAHGAFREHPSTHGQQFWVVDKLGDTRPDGTQCETVLWDLAGQPDYRLVHALFLDNVDLGLLLFDPANRERPLSGVEYWIKHLNAATLREATAGTAESGDPLATTAPTLLVAARSDRGTPTRTDAEIDAFCQRHGISGYVRTSARDNIGIDDLLASIKAAIPWERLTQTVTTDTFKRVKDHVLRLKEAGGTKTDALLPEDALREQLQATDPAWRFEDAEMLTSVRHLANHGYVALIQRADGEHSILLASDLLVNLASSIVLEARRHERGLGMVDEARLLAGDYALPELAGLDPDQRRLLLDEAVRLFLRRNLCFRETVNGSTNLVFPSLINEKRPSAAAALTDDVTYQITGEVETVYPALVVQLGYTNLFRQEHHWQTQAEYELEPGQLCGFRQTAESDGEIELVLSYSLGAGEDTRLLFRSVFERFLKRRRVQVTRLPAVICSKCKQVQERAAVRRAIDADRPQLFCDACGTKLATPALDEIGIPPDDKAETVREATETADRRTEYEVAVSWVKSFRRERGDARPPTCFISYAWGDPRHERWVEDLADRLQQAEIDVTLDKWHCRPGTDLAKFVERIAPSDFICAIGTPSYRQKYDDPKLDAVVRAELRVINARHIKGDKHHDTVIPLLREASRDESYPPLLRTSVFVDMRSDRDFLARLFELVLTIHRIGFQELMARQHRAAIAGGDRH